MRDITRIHKPGSERVRCNADPTEWAKATLREKWNDHLLITQILIRKNSEKREEQNCEGLSKDTIAKLTKFFCLRLAPFYFSFSSGPRMKNKELQKLKEKNMELLLQMRIKLTKLYQSLKRLTPLHCPIQPPWDEDSLWGGRGGINPFATYYAYIWVILRRIIEFLKQMWAPHN